MDSEFLMFKLRKENEVWACFQLYSFLLLNPP